MASPTGQQVDHVSRETSCWLDQENKSEVAGQQNANNLQFGAVRAVYELCMLLFLVLFPPPLLELLSLLKSLQTAAWSNTCPGIPSNHTPS